MTNATMEETQETREQLAEACRQRAAQYGFISRLFRKEITPELLDELHGLHYRVHTGNDNIDEGYRLIATYLSGIWDNTITELAADYMRTFFGHGYSGHAAAYPFESIYTNEKRLLMQGARDEVLALYRAAGLDKKADWKEGEDHIALELEYMQVLALRTANALEAGNERQATTLLKSQLNFLNDHLYAWAPLLAIDMKRFSQTGFYTGLAFLMEGFLEEDVELLEDILEE
ncbi:molecular chaperone [Denitrobacterium detoxificans]|uniref:TorD/DmsD family molecular chaperone n=1 Tax=Denitrobacterium detoxificans TaxID=79604 RepID=UPI0026F11569|nr:molecular chaperone TorD family protein [Denitrobacterium detoxificans]